jgi:hypothetical protein
MHGINISGIVDIHFHYNILHCTMADLCRCQSFFQYFCVGNWYLQKTTEHQNLPGKRSDLRYQLSILCSP